MDPIERDEMLYGEPPSDWVETDQVLTQDDAARRWRRALATQSKIDELADVFDTEARRLAERRAEVLGPLEQYRDTMVAHVEQWHRRHVAEGGSPTVRWPAGGQTLVKKAGRPELVVTDEERLEASVEALGLTDEVFPVPPPPVRKLSKAALRRGPFEMVEGKDSDPGTPIRLHVGGTVVEGVELRAKPREFHPTLEASDG